ncbi:MAG: transglycosylase domain-containing protein [Bacteroidota bacterium]|nr:transglycosylase domain-containing protein [Bacteroidota bacterium]
MKKKKEGSNRNIFFGKKFWAFVFILVCIPFLLIALVATGIFGELPSTVELENPKTPVATEIISSDGVILGKYYDEANRSMLEYEDLSKNLIHALIATEDARYRDHAGIDFRALVRVAFKTVLFSRQSSGGGSTVSQQLAKNLFPRGQDLNTFQLVIRKIQENMLAVKLERLYTKEEIIAMYFNTVDFGSNSVGIKSAANTFFNKSPSELTVPQSAILVGLLKAPTRYSPVRNPENSMGRRNTVLSQMEKYGYLTEDQLTKYKRSPLELDYRVESHNVGLGTYFREHLRPIIQLWAQKHGYDIYKDGLKIHTSIDSRMQRYAEDAVNKHMKSLQSGFYRSWRAKKQVPWHETPEIIDLTVKRSERYRAMKVNGATTEDIQKSFAKPRKMKIFAYSGEKDTIMSPLDSIKYYKYFLHPGFMVMEPHSGHVKAWVGGVNYRFFKYDHITGTRQVGSTFKPFVYATAIANGYSPCLKYPNTPVVFTEYDNWEPRNSDGSVGGERTLREGLKNSINLITARLVKDVGIRTVIELARNMGVTTKLDPVPSLSLGTADISVLEMVAAFNTFNSKGVYVQPNYIIRIEDKNGRVLETSEFIPNTKEALNEKHSYIMIDMLKSVVNGGTGSRMRFRHNVRGPLAGKTGTTQNNSDGWFIAMTPQLTGGVWVGAEDRAVHFTSLSEGQGASMALPIMGYFMESLYKDEKIGFDKTKDWDRPPGDLGIEINCSKYEDEADPEVDITKELFGMGAN